MTKSEAREWFKNRMDSGLMPETREAYKAALSALTVEHNSPTMKQAKKAWQGHWVDCRDDREFCQCSECNYPVFKNWNKGDFCPNCGTPMTDKALRELLKRLEMLKDDKTDTPPPNEPLTPDELLGMDGEPAWWDAGKGSCWGIICVDSSGIFAGIPFFRGRWRGANFEYGIEARGMTLYRRPPEGAAGNAKRKCEHWQWRGWKEA